MIEQTENVEPVPNTSSKPYTVTCLPPAGFLRLPQIVGDSKLGIPAIIPVSKSTWFEGIKSGRYPAGVKLSERCTAWRVSDILALIEQAGEAA